MSTQRARIQWAQEVFDLWDPKTDYKGKLPYRTQAGQKKEIGIKEYMHRMKSYLDSKELRVSPELRKTVEDLNKTPPSTTTQKAKKYKDPKGSSGRSPRAEKEALEAEAQDETIEYATSNQDQLFLEEHKARLERYLERLNDPDEKFKDFVVSEISKIYDESESFVEDPSLEDRQDYTDEWVRIRNRAENALKSVQKPGSGKKSIIDNEQKIKKLQAKRQEIAERQSSEEEKSPEPVVRQAPSAASESIFELYMREVEHFAKSGDAKKLVEFQTKAENAGLNPSEMNFLEKSINDLVKKRTLPKPNAELEYLLEREQLQKIQRAEKERAEQERLERSGQPQVEVDSIDYSDPRTGTGVVASIYNEDRELVDNPNLPINMQLNPPVSILDTTPLVMAQNVMPLVDNQVSGTHVELEEKEDFVAVPQVDIAAETQAEGGAVPDFGDAGAGAMPQVDIAAAASVASGSMDSGDSGFFTAQEPPGIDQNMPQDTTQQPQLGVSIETTYKVKYHKAQTNEFFGSVEKPTWDMALNRTITLNYDNKYYEPTKETLLDLMNQMISNKNLKVYKLATGIDSDVLDILTEYVIISQIHFCVLRNLQRGERTKTAIVPLKSLIDMRNAVAGVGGPAPVVGTAGSALGTGGSDGLTSDFASAAGEQTTPTQFQPTPTETAPSTGIQTVDQLFPDARQDVIGRDITQRDIGERWLNRNGRRDGQLFGKHYQSIKESRARHSGGENFIFTGAAKGDLFNTYGDEKNMTKTGLRVSNVDLAPY
jgi:hypothetical protein